MREVDMALLSDFITIQGDASVTIGDANSQATFPFNTGGRHASGQAFLMLMVRGMTEATENANVAINGVSVGQIRRRNGADPDHWFTEIINVGGGQLENGNNILGIGRVPRLTPTPDNQFDDFLVRNIICFFQQDV